jgi:hypothetical protein
MGAVSASMCGSPMGPGPCATKAVAAPWTVATPFARTGRLRRCGGYSPETKLSACDPASLILRTCADVPWNAPYYRRLGFAEVARVVGSPGERDLRPAYTAPLRARLPGAKPAPQPAPPAAATAAPRAVERAGPPAARNLRLGDRGVTTAASPAARLGPRGLLDEAQVAEVTGPRPPPHPCARSRPRKEKAKNLRHPLDAPKGGGVHWASSPRRSAPSDQDSSQCAANRPCSRSSRRPA